ncbi:uncharacterized protein LOC100251975 isoform X1 [Vitis vinifera]|uniref:uncharacterized protein LOC100251975 isoform X1 n=1 Tax=Vitis vinifera TaxID=29760 RepID=UPI00288301F6|nr:uncharacterized protein LOC100251975 isoform X1 [Vitis vinifera]
MAESNTSLGTPETDMTTLKEALWAQQQLLQKLYSELDEEREASATAASETLSMILRLQGEKAAVKMEASQYKRMAEERMCHAEKSLSLFEELIYQKEMEIASLEFQVQAYRCKLLSMGYSDPVAGDTRFPDNLLLQRNESLVGDTSVNDIVRRSNSLPSIRLKDSYHKKAIIERERSMIPLIPRIVEENMDQELGDQNFDLEKKSENSSAVGDYDSYWEQIRRLDKKVKELSDCKDSSRGGKSANLKAGSRSSLPSQVSMTSYDLTSGDMTTKSGKVKHPGGFLEDGAITNSACAFGVHDIFEVPKAIKNHKSCERMKKEQSKLILEDEDRLLMPDSVSKEAAESYIRDETDWEKESFLSANHENRLIKPKHGMAFESDLAFPCSTIGVAECQAEFQQLVRRMKQLEDEREIIRQDNGGEEELKLLREIHEKLNLIQSEIESLRPKKRSPPPDDPALVSLMEVSPFSLALSISIDH